MFLLNHSHVCVHVGQPCCAPSPHVACWWPVWPEGLDCFSDSWQGTGQFTRMLRVCVCVGSMQELPTWDKCWRAAVLVSWLALDFTVHHLLALTSLWNLISLACLCCLTWTWLLWVSWALTWLCWGLLHFHHSFPPVMASAFWAAPVIGTATFHKGSWPQLTESSEPPGPCGEWWSWCHCSASFGEVPHATKRWTWKTVSFIFFFF